MSIVRGVRGVRCRPRAALEAGVGVVLAGCASAPPAPAPAPSVQIAPAPAVSASVIATASATVAPAAPPGRRFVSESRHLFDDLDDDTGPAPCDFARTYRGTVGEVPLTILLASPAPDKVSGLAHYDRPGPALALTGARRGDREITIEEKGGGRFEGRCDDTGALRGTYEIRGKKSAFVFHPRPAEWPPLHRIARTATVEPHHPRCAKEAQPDHPVELLDADENRILCLPTQAKAKKELFADAPYLWCSADDRGYRVFGLPDATAEARTNKILDAGGFDDDRKKIKGCTSQMNLRRYDRLVVARRDLLVVSSFHSDDYGGAHPANGGGYATVIDLAHGAAVELREIVDPARLREVTLACLPFHRAAQEKEEVVLEGPLPPASCADEPSLGGILWACEKDYHQAPLWSLLPEGIVIGQWGNPHVTAALDGMGPVIPWSVLLRDGALRPASPLARLWAGVAAAPAGAVACPMAYWRDSLQVWREQ